MGISLIYLLNQAGYRVLEFFRHWYVGGFLTASHLSLNVLERFDRIFAFKITLKNLFQPLYQDYSVIGYLWGFVFRSFRLIAGSIVYGALVLISVTLYLIWVAIPIYIIYNILINIT